MSSAAYLAENVVWTATCCNNNSYHLLGAYYTPGTLPSVLYVLSHLILTILPDRHSFFFSVLCTENYSVQRLISCPGFIEPENGEASSECSSCWLQNKLLCAWIQGISAFRMLSIPGIHQLCTLPALLRWWRDVACLIKGSPGQF